MINQATHIEIFKEIMKRIFREYIKSLWSRKGTVCFVELPLLFETKVFAYIVSTIVCITTTPDNQLKWLMGRNHYTEEEALQRIKAQIPVKEKARRSHFVIENVKDREYLKQQTIEMVEYCRNNTRIFGMTVLLSVIALITLIFIVRLFL